MANDLKSTSKFLSLVLRHRPSLVGVELDHEGWMSVAELVDGARRIGRGLSLEELKEVVAADDKQRFMLSDNGLFIRANQGHSISGVNLALQPQVPPQRLYHGTVPRFLESIRKQGILKRTRHHVHLSADVETARKVGSRRGEPIILIIRADEMYRDGLKFYLSANGVWLTDRVPPEYIGLDNAGKLSEV